MTVEGGFASFIIIPVFSHRQIEFFHILKPNLSRANSLSVIWSENNGAKIWFLAAKSLHLVP